MLKVKNVTFKYHKKNTVENISFSASKGDYIAIIGESGCGKSTLLEIIYGLLHIDIGEVYWNETKLLGPKFSLIPGEEFMKYLPQDFNLMPYITVEENIGKHLSRLDNNRDKRIQQLLEVVDMVDFKHQKVKNLSGGQKQRVAIAKVLANEPEVLLLDEPFSHIDNFRKNKLRRNLFRYLKQQNIVTIVATHDTTDALSFADEVLVIKNGKIVAKNTPEILYKHPPSEYVASFFDDINVIGNSTEIKKYRYPHQLKIVENSNQQATVIQSYFKGQNYLIEASYNNTIIYIEHHQKLAEGITVCIEIN